jgi:GNAT superfamily N-acetyltransferase
MIDARGIKLMKVDAANIDTEHICCAIGNDAVNRRRADEKRAWLKTRFDLGHRFKKADVRGKVFIEYCPAEKALFPVEADGYMFIQCFWVSGRYKGHGLGKKLYEACEAESRKEGYKGMVAVSSVKKRPFMVDRKFLVKFGFAPVDEAPLFFELLVKKFDSSAPDPRFMDSARRGNLEGKKGLTFFYSPLCPYNKDFTEEMAEAGSEMGIPVEIIVIDTRDKVSLLPVPWGVFCLLYNGQFLAHEVMTKKRFVDTLNEIRG